MGFFQLRSRPPDTPQAIGTATWLDAAGVATFVGTGIVALSLAAGGTASAAFVGVSTNASPVTAAGAGAAAFVGTAITPGALAVSDPAGAATFVGASTAASVLAAAGSSPVTLYAPSALIVSDPAGTATFVGASTAAGVLSASGSGAAAWVGSSTSAGNGALAAAGTGTATWIGASTTAGVLASTGSGATSLIGASTFAGTLSASGAGAASWVGASSATAVLSAAGAGTPAWVGGPSTLASTGSSAVSFVGASTVASVLSAAGTGTNPWLQPVAGTLSAAGSSGVTWFQVGLSTWAMAGVGNATFVAVPPTPPTPKPLPPRPVPLLPPEPLGSLAPTDQDQLAEIQAVLQEDGTFSNGLWTLQEVLGYFNQRQYRFLLETQILAATMNIVWTPEVEQMPLPTDWIATISATWHDYAADEIYPLPRSDRFELDRLLGPTVVITTGPPQAFREEDTTETLSIAVSPAPASPGALGLLYVSLSELLDGQGQIFDVPSDFVPYIKYGVYADMLGKMGRGQDLLRARYAEQRFQEGIVLAQSLLQGWP